MLESVALKQNTIQCSELLEPSSDGIFQEWHCQNESSPKNGNKVTQTFLPPVMSSPDNFGHDSLSSENASQPASLTDSMAMVNKILVSSFTSSKPVLVFQRVLICKKNIVDFLRWRGALGDLGPIVGPWNSSFESFLSLSWCKI